MVRVIVVLFFINSNVNLNAQFTYTNPIIHADYSDPDAIRVGSDYYMTASSFTSVPGLPILHSKDLVHWELIGHALQKLVPEQYYDTVRHGGGVWAPAIRYHNNEFYIFYPDPDFGIYVIKAKNIKGPWTAPKLVQAGKGLIDPCPLWDEDGKVYLAHAFAGSRAGFKSILVVKELNAAADSAIGNDVLVYDGHEKDVTVEGPKLYKRNGYYHIFAPAGGVSTGWQLALRSKNIYGPYERKVVLEQGKTSVNGPHQGAWITDTQNKDWFIHFQDRDAYGRIVHLQPMTWKNDFPFIGKDNDGNGIGEPVLEQKINLKKVDYSIPTSDEFNTPILGKQWQWQANPKTGWAFPTADGYLQTFAALTPPNTSVWKYPNILTQKFPDSSFTATIHFNFMPNTVGETFGFGVFGTDYAFIAVTKKKDGNYVQLITCRNAEAVSKDSILTEVKVKDNDFWIEVDITKNSTYQFSWNCKKDLLFGETQGIFQTDFTAKPGKWVGAKIGFFNTRIEKTNNAGYTLIDKFIIEKTK